MPCSLYVPGISYQMRLLGWMAATSYRRRNDHLVSRVIHCFTRRWFAVKRRAYRIQLTNALKLWQKSGYSADTRKIIRAHAASRVSLWLSLPISFDFRWTNSSLLSISFSEAYGFLFKGQTVSGKLRLLPNEGSNIFLPLSVRRVKNSLQVKLVLEFHS